jgi:predicted Zn-dependent peptidase
LAKKFINYSAYLRFDNPVNIAYYISDQEFDREEIWFPERYEEESNSIGKEDVTKMAKEIFDFSKINIGLLGNIPTKLVNKIKQIFLEK